jgi:hypothetical protein
MNRELLDTQLHRELGHTQQVAELCARLDVIVLDALSLWKLGAVRLEFVERH